MGEGLLPLLKGGHEIKLGLVLDGLSEAQNEELGAALAWVHEEAGKNHYKVWCVTSVTWASEDTLPELGDDFQIIKVPPLHKPETTAVLYSTFARHGPHLLSSPAGLFMRIFKEQAGSPGYVAALASLLCQRPRVASIAHEIDLLPGTLAALVRDVVPAMLERDFNPHGQLFRTPFEPGAPNHEALPVEALLVLLADAGDQGVFVADVPALLAKRATHAPAGQPSSALPAAVLEGLLAALTPYLAGAPSLGERRVALRSDHPLRAAILARYFPTALMVRGSGCRQLTVRAAPLRAPARQVFAGRGGGLPEAPVVVLDLVDPRRLETGKRLVARLLAELTEQAASTGRPGKFALLSCAAGSREMAGAMQDADPAGNAERAALKWLGTVLPGGERIEWSGILENIAALGQTAGHIFLLSDRAPGVSHERVMDEVGATESEIGKGWRAVVHCVSLDGAASVDRALRKLARETAARFSQVSLAHMRQHLIALSSPETILADALAGLAAPGPGVPLVDFYIRDGSAERAAGGAPGRPAVPLLLAPPRAVVVTRFGQAESALPDIPCATERGLRVSVLAPDLSERSGRTYDTHVQPRTC
ncbi:hypothetical protein T484DRAFT_1844047 [Baffinella frigidus]|nr:hypothetical protein T484DRAFT_1844047 [Cryptophyta sp. CCMP2293]